MNINGRTLGRAACCCLIAALLAGCAAISSLTGSGDPLDQRVKQYMQAQSEGQWDRAYAYLDTASREKVPKERYTNRAGKVGYKGYLIEEITMLPSGDQATVNLKIDISFMGYTFKAPQTQTWIRERGDWFVKYDPQSRRTPFGEQKKPN